jgi:hypothetical protein
LSYKIKLILGHFPNSWDHLPDGGARRWSGTSASSKLASPGSMMQRALVDYRGVMDLHMVGFMSGAMVAPMAGLPRAMRSSTMKMDQS